jgi:eukaryotic-like serine/threonine-protein kinase
VMGTVGYMSPEQVRGQPADHRTDIFSFGAILYEMLAGKRAFQKPTAADTQSAILNEDPPSISQVTTSIPPALQRVVHRCLEKRPEERFQSASDLAFALDALSQGPGSAPAVESVEPQKGRSARLWLIAGVALIILAAFGFWRWRAGSASTRHGELIRKQLTASAPEDPVTSAALSRDGKYLAYTTVVSKKTHILEVDSGESRDLPASDAPEPSDWFPDGSHLLVRRPGFPEIWKVSVWDGSYHKLFAGNEIWDARVSPDGGWVAFSQMDKGEIWLMGSDGQDLHRVLAPQGAESFANVAWSPHGQRLVYGHIKTIANKPQASIETCDLAGANRTVLYSDQGAWRGWVPAFNWLPDGRVVFSFLENPAFIFNLKGIAADPDSGKPLSPPVPITTWEQSEEDLIGSSADGKRLIYDSHRDRDVLFLADLRSGNKAVNIRRMTSEDWPSIPSDWTRDSRALYFTSTQHGKSSILKQNLDAHAPEIVVSGSESYGGAVLSPNGDHLLFNVISPQAQERKIVTMPVEGGTRSVLFSGHYRFFCARSPSGGCVLGEAQGQEMVFSVLDPVKGKGAEIVRLKDTPVDLSDWALSPDGTKIATAEAPKWVRIVTVADHKVVDLPHRAKWSNAQFITWGADSKHVFVAAWPESGITSEAILSVDLDGNAEVVTGVPFGSAWLEDMKVSPDGRYLAFTKRIFEGNITMLENF